jgi:hypothetical protein
MALGLLVDKLVPPISTAVNVIRDLPSFWNQDSNRAGFFIGLAFFMVLVLLVVWPNITALTLLRRVFSAHSSRGYFLTALALYVLALGLLWSLPSLAELFYGRVPLQPVTFLTPPAVLLVASAVLLFRARSSLRFWLGYLIFIPLVLVGIDTISRGRFCHNLDSTWNIIFVRYMEAPWLSVGFALAGLMLTLFAVNVWKNESLGVRSGLKTIALWVPLFMLLGSIVMFESEPSLTDCGFSRDASGLHHVFGEFYW